MNKDKSYCNNSLECSDKDCDRKFSYKLDGNFCFSEFPSCDRWQELEKAKWDKKLNEVEDERINRITESSIGLLCR